MFGKAETDAMGFTLETIGVDGIAAHALERFPVGRDTKARELLRLSLEGVLLRLAENGLEGASCSLHIEKRLRSKLLVIECAGRLGVGEAAEGEPGARADANASAGEGPDVSSGAAAPDEFSAEFLSNLGSEWTVSVTPAGVRSTRTPPGGDAASASAD